MIPKKKVVIGNEMRRRGSEILAKVNKQTNTLATTIQG